MKRLLFGLSLAAFFMLACKSDTKESTTETAADSTTVTQPLVEVSLDTAAVSEENKKTALAPATSASKPAATSKPAPADKSKGAAPAPAASSSTTDADGYVEFPSKRATYPGGQDALNKYLADNIKYPAMARENKIEGTVYASIMVDEHGKILDVSFPKPLGNGLEEEVLRVIKGMPALIPAEDHSKPVKTKYLLPVKFKLM